MKATELRIGNLFKEAKSKEIIMVTELSKEKIGFSGSFPKGWQAEPIPLTEEWLLKFGFEFNVLTNRYELDDWRFDITKPANYDGLLLCDGSTAITDRIKHVHQLQNLYFALTGEELTSK